MGSPLRPCATHPFLPPSLVLPRAATYSSSLFLLLLPSFPPSLPPSPPPLPPPSSFRHYHSIEQQHALPPFLPPFLVLPPFLEEKRLLGFSEAKFDLSMLPPGRRRRRRRRSSSSSSSSSRCRREGGREGGRERGRATYSYYENDVV